MRLLPFLWFSMKLGMINSFLIVFYNGSKNIQVGEILQKFLQKYHVMAIKQYLGENVLLLQ